MPSKETQMEKDCVLVTEEEIKNTRPWKPTSLRLPFLVFILFTTAALIIVLQWLLYRSQTEGGVLFAPSIKDLPLSKTVGYLYAPTIIATVYGILWNWIDLDIKRLEPYFQLCAPGGASVENSLLLQYPFDFVALVPLYAARRKHWSVFTTGLAVVIILWTLTPLQAGIFAIEDRMIMTTIPFVSSTSYLPTSQQKVVSALYAQRAYNIAWLNATLPPYTTRDAVLSPFRPSTNLTTKENEIWTGTTQLYSLDISCEAPIDYRDEHALYYNSSNGCSYGAPALRVTTNNDTSKYIEALYVGYQNDNGIADYYLSTDCPPSASHTFLVRTATISEAAIMNTTITLDEADREFVNSTVLYCEPRYFVQEVNASVAAANRSVISITPIGEKLSLPEDIFDINKFEWAMSSGQAQDSSSRSGFPTWRWPDQKSHFVDTPLNLNYLPKMVPFSFAALQMPSLEDYMEPEVLWRSYEAAYRLLFVAQMADIVQSDFGNTAIRYTGQRAYRTQAITLIPGLTYAVEALLATALFLLLSVIYFTMTRKNVLRADPSAMGSSMSAVAEDNKILQIFGKLDKASTRELARTLEGSQFVMDAEAHIQLKRVPATTFDQLYSSKETARAKGVQAPELRWYSGTLFLATQFICIGTLGYLFYWTKINNGIPLPSNQRFVRQLIENYVPTAIATAMEPFWILLTRQICVLQPFEELRKGKATSSKSVSLDYTSLPPQLVIFRAFRAGHFMLALLCVMTLLANVLSVAFSGLFFEDKTAQKIQTKFQPLLSLPFQALNGSAPPFNSNTSTNWQGGTTQDQFYIAMSNATASSKLPSWTDPYRFYFSVDLPESEDIETNYTVTTNYFGADLRCQELSEYEGLNGGEQATYRFAGGHFDFNVTHSSGVKINCSTKVLVDNPWDGITGPSALELAFAADSSEICQQYVVAGWWRGYAFNNTVTKKEETTMLCLPVLRTGSAKVTVTSGGYVLESDILQSTDGSLGEYFTTESKDLILQAHQFVVQTPYIAQKSGSWHNDSNFSDWQNFLIGETFVDERFVDPTLSQPTFAEAAPVFAAMYNKLFAILLGHNKDLLFTRTPPSSELVPGSRIQPETRIFISFPAFIVAEVILCIYAVTTVFLYTRRPWRILPRLPTTIASSVAFFAASYGVREFGRSAGLSAYERHRWLNHLDHRWAFGSFMGVDGRIHIGVEREPFVALLEHERIPCDKTLLKDKDQLT